MHRSPMPARRWRQGSNQVHRGGGRYERLWCDWRKVEEKIDNELAHGSTTRAMSISLMKVFSRVGAAVRRRFNLL